jgi:hypothetical protein
MSFRSRFLALALALHDFFRNIFQHVRVHVREGGEVGEL